MPNDLPHVQIQSSEELIIIFRGIAIENPQPLLTGGNVKKMAWVVIACAHGKSINDIIRNPKGAVQAINNKTAIVNNDVESLIVDD